MRQCWVITENEAFAEVIRIYCNNKSQEQPWIPYEAAKFSRH